MNQPRLERKVGLFVLIGLVLMAGLLLQFSKGLTFFRPSYQLNLKAANIGGLKNRAAVLLSGVQIGSVTGADLSPDGKSVTIFVRIYSTYVIHRDARFIIEQSGFLGDQYISIIPTKNLAEPLQPGDEVPVEEPFNLQEVARDAAGFIQRIDETAKRLNASIDDVRRLVLNEHTLTNLALTVDTVRDASLDAEATIQSINALVQTNAAPLSGSISNLARFTERLNLFGKSLQDLVNTNSDEITSAIKNMETSTMMLTNLLAEVQSGKGLAGQLLTDSQLADNVNLIASNLAVTTSNLNRLGLWRLLWKPREPHTNPPSPTALSAPKNSQ